MFTIKSVQCYSRGVDGNMCVPSANEKNNYMGGISNFLFSKIDYFAILTLFFSEECVFFKFRIYQKIEFILSIQCSCKLCIYMYPTNLLFSINMLHFLFNIENKYRWEQVVNYWVSGYKDNIKSRIIIEPN